VCEIVCDVVLFHCKSEVAKRNGDLQEVFNWYRANKRLLDLKYDPDRELKLRSAGAKVYQLNYQHTDPSTEAEKMLIDSSPQKNGACVPGLPSNALESLLVDNMEKSPRADAVLENVETPGFVERLPSYPASMLPAIVSNNLHHPSVFTANKLPPVGGRTSGSPERHSRSVSADEQPLSIKGGMSGSTRLSPIEGHSRSSSGPERPLRSIMVNLPSAGSPRQPERLLTAETFPVKGSEVCFSFASSLKF
jgi:hypothetical protein